MNIPSSLNNSLNTSATGSPYAGTPTNSVLGINHLHNDASHGLIKLNIGGRLYTTTKQTLLSKGENFFSPLLSGDIPSVKDDNGAYFVDRNGRFFEPILDFLRNGTLILPPSMSLESVLIEANFYGIDVMEGLGNIQEGLYTSTNWILFIERDKKHPWIFGITGVEERTKHVFCKQSCHIKDGVIHWNGYELYTHDDKFYIWDPRVFNSEAQLFHRCSMNPKFPLNLNQILVSDRGFENDFITISFQSTPKGIQAKTALLSTTPSIESKYQPMLFSIEVLCKCLFLATDKSSSWLLYLPSDVAFFVFHHPYLEFGEPFHKPTS
jgi:hypothetical protein